MAVARLEGKVNGQDIIFTRSGGDIWESIFHFIEKYDAVIELTAYDEAGNYSFKTCYLLTFDPESLSICLVPVDYWLKLVQEETILFCVTPVDYSLSLRPDAVHLQYWGEGEGLVSSYDQFCPG